MSEQMREEFKKLFDEFAAKYDQHSDAWQDMPLDEVFIAGCIASRQALVVKLPVLFVDGVDAAEYRDCVLESLNDAGVPYKEMPINNEVSNGGK